LSYQKVPREPLIWAIGTRYNIDIKQSGAQIAHQKEHTNMSTTTQATADTEEIVGAEEPIVTFEAAEKFLMQQFKSVERLASQYEAGLVNPIVLAKAIKVRPQMIYNYCREPNARIQSHLNDTQHIVIVWKDAVEFVQKYLDRKAQAQARIEAELAGESGTENNS
jgi:hypothetical protein